MLCNEDNLEGKSQELTVENPHFVRKVYPWGYGPSFYC